MEFLKKNYEKILLALVLVGLTAAVAALTIFIPHEQESLDAMRTGFQKKSHPPLPPFDGGVEEAALKRMDAPYQIDLVTKHRVFNPVLWQINSDGRLRKIESVDQIGPAALKLASVNPIYLTVTYVTNRVNGYEVKQRNDTAVRPVDRPGVIHPDSSSDMFILRKVEGSADSPTALVLEFKDASHEQFTLKADPEQPYRKIVAYSADLKAPDSNVQFNKVRSPAPGLPPALSTLNFDGVQYKVIDVASNYVIVSAPNNKHTTIPLSRSSE